MYSLFLCQFYIYLNFSLSLFLFLFYAISFSPYFYLPRFYRINSAILFFFSFT